MHADDTYGIYAYIHWGNMNVTPVHRRMDGRTDGRMDRQWKAVQYRTWAEYAIDIFV